MKIEIEREDDGRWIAEVPDLPGVMTYGATRQSAVDKAEALALRVIAARLDHGGAIPELNELFAVTARAIALQQGACCASRHAPYRMDGNPALRTGSLRSPARRISPLRFTTAMRSAPRCSLASRDGRPYPGRSAKMSEPAVGRATQKARAS